MCDRFHYSKECTGTTSLPHPAPSRNKFTWPNLPTPVEMDYSGRCSRYKELVLMRPPCLDYATWPSDGCKRHIRIPDCRKPRQVKVKKSLNSIPQEWPKQVKPLEITWWTQMSNTDRRKYHIPGYSGYVPRLQFGTKFGTYSLNTHRALNEFSDIQEGIRDPDSCLQCPTNTSDFPRDDGPRPTGQLSCHIGCGVMPFCTWKTY